MPSVFAVAYTKRGRLHYVDAAGLSVPVGERIVVAYPDRERVGTVLWGPSEPLEPVGTLPRALRAAAPNDTQQADDGVRRAARAKTAAKRLIRQRALPMQVLGTDWVSADQRVTIWFAAPRRIDFRELLRALTAEIGMRVLLRQVSERERAKIVGGVGICGRELCCSTFLDAFEPVTLQMARDQHLGTDPLRISGACGRLMCCLRYEHPSYVDFTAHPPQAGSGGGCADAAGCGPRAAHDDAHS